MHHRSLAVLSLATLTLAAFAASVGTSDAQGGALPKPKPTSKSSPAAKVSPAPAGSGAMISSGPAQTRFGDLTVNFAEGEGNLKTGDFVMPGTVTGHSTDGTFRGDRAFGNSKRDEITLVGHAMVNKLGGVSK